VTRHDGSASVEAVTDSTGRAHFTVDHQQLRAAPAPPHPLPPLSLGTVDIAVAASGWTQHRLRMVVADDIAVRAVRDHAVRLRSEAVRSLAEVAKLGTLPQRTARPASVGEVAALPHGTGRSTVHGTAVDLGVPFAALDHVTNCLAMTPQDPFVFHLLGIPLDAGPDAVIHRLDLLWAELHRRFPRSGPASQAGAG
jgi:hypothetical protein